MAATISGLKYTTGLSMASLGGVPPSSLGALCGLLAGRRINLPFLISSQSTDNANCVCLCFEQSCYPAAREMIADCLAGCQAKTEFFQDVAALTLYPRGRGLGLALGVPAALLAAGCTPLGAGSSLAAAVVLVEGGLLWDALEVLQRAFPLPPGQKPVGEKIKVVQKPRR